MLERYNQEIIDAHRHIVRVFPNGESCLRLSVFRAVQRSLLRVIAEQPVESADGISISASVMLATLTGARCWRRNCVHILRECRGFSDANRRKLAHGDITRIVVTGFQSPSVPGWRNAARRGGEHGVRHVVWRFRWPSSRGRSRCRVRGGGGGPEWAAIKGAHPDVANGSRRIGHHVRNVSCRARAASMVHSLEQRLEPSHAFTVAEKRTSAGCSSW